MAGLFDEANRGLPGGNVLAFRPTARVAAPAAAPAPARELRPAPQASAFAGSMPAVRPSPLVRAAALRAPAQAATPSFASPLRPAPLAPSAPSGRGSALASRVAAMASSAPPPAAVVLPASLAETYAAPAPAAFAAPVYASPAFLPSGAGGGGGAFAEEPEAYDPAAAAPMQTRSLVGVEAPNTVWIILGVGLVGLVGWGLYKRESKR